MIGAPFIQAQQLADEMNAKGIPGVLFRPVHFKPTSSKHCGELCGGVQIYITDLQVLRPLEVGVTLLFTIRDLYEQFSFLPPVKEGSRPFIDLLGETTCIVRKICKPSRCLNSLQRKASNLQK